mgnify:CR=1 FL=1
MRNNWYNGNVDYSRHMQQEEPMVGASEAIRVLRIPRTNFYRAIKEGKIPVHEVKQPWNRRAVVKRFLLSEVREALDMEPPADA